MSTVNSSVGNNGGMDRASRSRDGFTSGGIITNHVIAFEAFSTSVYSVAFGAMFGAARQARVVSVNINQSESVEANLADIIVADLTSSCRALYAVVSHRVISFNTLEAVAGGIAVSALFRARNASLLLGEII